VDFGVVVTGGAEAKAVGDLIAVNGELAPKVFRIEPVVGVHDNCGFQISRSLRFAFDRPSLCEAA
jgi:hypothetical protein